MSERGPDDDPAEAKPNPELLSTEARIRARELARGIQAKADQRERLSDPAEFQAALKRSVD